MSTDNGAQRLGYLPMPIREDRIPAVTALLAKLDRDEALAKASDVEIVSLERVLDEELVRRMFIESEGKHRKLLMALAERPNEWVFTEELATATGIESGSKGMAGTFGAFGRRAKHRYDGAKPWESAWDLGKGEAKYRMTPEVAAWTRGIAASAEEQG